MLNITDLGNLTKQIDSRNVARAVTDAIESIGKQRISFERRWYDNNFFDDGFHFKKINKRTGRIINHVDRDSTQAIHAIPRASKQIRGVINLIMSADPQPVVYPERIDRADFENEEPQFDEMGQPINMYEQYTDINKKTAARVGTWLIETWRDHDMEQKMIHMLLNAAKQGVGYMQFDYDDKLDDITETVYDAFDIYLQGQKEDIESQPIIIKTAPYSMKDLRHTFNVSADKVDKIQKDNRFAYSDVKNSYMSGRYGTKGDGSNKDTIIVCEAFIKERLDKDNFRKIAKSAEKEGRDTLRGKVEGDSIIRHVFVADEVTLQDEYLEWNQYPIVSYTFEPGPLYQVPMLERLIPQNKSLDIVMNRIERYINAMTVGAYQKRKGENVQISNTNGIVFEYETAPVTQMNMQTIPGHVFNFMNKLDEYMNEQGASTTMGVLPEGVKSGVAIENVKATEYANLKVATKQLEKTLRHTAHKMLYIADKYFIKPRTVYHMEKGQPDYFDIVGQEGADMIEKMGMSMPEDTIPLKSSYKVRVEIEPGLGVTMQGKKEAVQQIIEYMRNLAQEGLVTPDAIKLVVEKFLDVYGFGGTAEFMEAMDTPPPIPEQPPAQNTDDIKLAVLQVLQDTGLVQPQQPPAQEQQPEPMQQPIEQAPIM